MKKHGLLILIVLFLSIIMFLLFTKANNDDLLKIGEEKYLEFLWFVDGAFNNERLEGEFEVNGKKLDSNNFTCKYDKKNKNTCIGENFEEEFKKIFSSKIGYDYVYSDKIIFSWIKYEKGKYYFSNPNNCNIKRMDLIQELTIKSINDKEIVYVVKFNDINNHLVTRDFVLINEDNEWKVKKAYYHDLCGLDYYIE